MRSAVKSYETDLLIVGGGGAAAMAAVEAARHGIKPLMLCKDTFLGGATVQASSGTSIPFLPDDSPGIFYNDTMKSGAYINDSRLVRVLTEEAQPSFYGLERDGCILDRSSPTRIRGIKRSEGHSVLRSYADRRQFHGIVGGLKRRVMEENVGLLEERMLLQLFTDDAGVHGGLFFSLEDGELEVVNAKVVVLVTGGCGQLYPVTTNAQCLSGDGYAIAFEAGAELVDMEMVQFLPLAFPYPATIRGAIIGMSSLFGTSVKLFNGLGERYMLRHDPEKLEYATRDSVARANYIEIQEGRGTKRKTIVVDPTGNDRSLLKEYRKSHAVVYDMIAETFGEKAANWEATFEAIPSQHFMMGGVRIDEHCRTSVRNLLCCGEISGGVHGANRLAGNALAELFVFGRRAGIQASEMARATPRRPLASDAVRSAVKRTHAWLDRQGGAPPGRVRERLQRAMWNHVGIVRDGEGLEKGLRALRRLKSDAEGMQTKCRSRHWNREWLEALELRLMIRTAEFIAMSALERQESRGSHYRRDYPKPDPSWLRNVVLSREGDGGIQVRTAPARSEA